MRTIRIRQSLLRICLAIIPGFLLALAICGCDSFQIAGALETPTVSIFANPMSILAGSSSTLTVTAKASTQVTVTGSDGSSYSLKSGGGTKIVRPSATTIYTAEAAGISGKDSANATLTVTVDPKPSVTITSYPTATVAGGSSTLTVTARNAGKVMVTGSNGAKYALHSSGGTQTVTPAATTSYTATASGAGGTVSAIARVTVTAHPKPSITIAADPIAIIVGSSSMLTVKATYATQVTITGTNGATFIMPASGGVKKVTPASTTTYTAIAIGTNGKAAATTEIAVKPHPKPSLTITANPASIWAGSASSLTVTTGNATRVIVTGTDGERFTLPAIGGKRTVSPAVTTTYTATASGAGGNTSKAATVLVTPIPIPSVSIIADPAIIASGNSSTLTITAIHATYVTLTGSDGSNYTMPSNGGNQPVSPATTTAYTVSATGPGGTTSKAATVTVKPAGSLQSIDHVIFMLQENHSFDNYFGMLNPYRKSNGWNIGDDGIDYEVDGIDDKLTTISNEDDEGTVYPLFKLTSTCIDDDSSDWLASYGSVNRYNFLTTRPILENGFVHTAEGFAKSCSQPGSSCSGNYTDLTGQRAMGYYDEGYLNYYYYMASQFAVSDRWFSPISSKSIDNRIATFTGGTTQGLVRDPGGNDHLSQLKISNIFKELDDAKVSWKIYYTVTQGFCLNDDDCGTSSNAKYPATDFSSLSYSFQYLYENPSGNACTGVTQASSIVGDSSNSFCIDPDRIAPLSTFFSDLNAGTLPSFAFIEAGYGNNDEHPGSGQSILLGQAQVANILNTFMDSPSWSDSVFFLSYDEGGGPYDHVPPVPGHSNDYTDPALGTIPDISQIAVNADSYVPCVPIGGVPTLHCDLALTDPGANSGDAAATQGFAAQLGFRLPNIVVSPFTRRHFVSHTPMDHTAIIKFVENRFIGPAAHLTLRDAAQPDLLEFFDFDATPWATPPTPPAPVTAKSLGHDPCTPTRMGP